MQWIIFGTLDRSEMGLITVENYASNSRARVDTSGQPFHIWLEFEAETYEQARAKYLEFLGLEPQNPEE